MSWVIAWGGVMFHSDGNFGSTTYDNVDEREYIQIFVCDECMKKKAKRIWRVKTVRHPPEDAEFTTFDVEPEWIRLKNLPKIRLKTLPKTNLPKKV